MTLTEAMEGCRWEGLGQVTRTNSGGGMSFDGEAIRERRGRAKMKNGSEER
jgi:hypothetical protein